MDHEKIVGIYTNPAYIIAHPDYLDAAKGEIGLNRIILEAEYNLSPQTRALNPLDFSPDRFAPGVPLVDNDYILQKALDEIHRRGIQAWAYSSWYFSGAEYAPELMARHLDGRRMDMFSPHLYAHEQITHTFCPTNKQINEWFDSCLVEIVSRYDFQGTALTHFRFSHPSFFEQLMACGCPSCQQVAGELGYDFEQMKVAVLSTVNALQHLPARAIRVASETNLGFMDLLQFLGQDAEGVIDWLNFRADVITLNLKRVSQIIHSATNPRFSFGTDINYPTMAILVGHRYRDFTTYCDHLIPLLCHHETQFIENIASFTDLLVHWSGVEESCALRLVYRLFGLDYPGLPTSIAEMHLGNPPNGEVYIKALPEIISGEILKARIYIGAEKPSYPVIKGAKWPATIVQRLVKAAEEAGHEGIIFQGTDALFSYK